MTNVDNLLIEHMRAIRTEIAAIRVDTREIKSRLITVENGISGLKHDAASQYGDLIETQHRFTRSSPSVTNVQNADWN